MLANLPVRYKITAVAVVTTAIVIFSASTVFVLLEINNYRRALVQELTAIAQITGSNSTAAILFDDRVAARETLSALRARPNIQSAALYKRSGALFARYGAPNAQTVWPQDLGYLVENGASQHEPPAYAVSWTLHSVDLYGPILLDNEVIGAIHIQSSLAQIYATIKTYLGVVLLIIALAIFSAWLLAARLQRQVTSPIHDLLETMRSVSRHHNYALRARKRGNDELGALIDGFNAMLAETEAHKAELNEARREAESASRMKSEFLAHMSHELRTPLNAILGFSDFMLNEPMGPLGHENYRNYMIDIQSGGRHLLDVINDILELSKIESGNASLHEEVVDIESLIAECVAQIEAAAVTAGVTVRVAVPAGAPHIFADELLLKRGLMNLLSNSVKFTPPGGEVTVRVRALPVRDFLLTVTDTGIGIAPEQVNHVLTPFGQAESVFQRSHDGTGLGLPLVKSFMEMHGGTLEIASRPHHGTRVTMRLPASRVRLRSIAGSARIPLKRPEIGAGPPAPAAGQTAERRESAAASPGRCGRPGVSHKIRTAYNNTHCRFWLSRSREKRAVKRPGILDIQIFNIINFFFYSDILRESR